MLKCEHKPFNGWLYAYLESIKFEFQFNNFQLNTNMMENPRMFLELYKTSASLGFETTNAFIFVFYTK